MCRGYLHACVCVRVLVSVLWIYFILFVSLVGLVGLVRLCVCLLVCVWCG